MTSTDTNTDPEHCDVLVIGAGPAGLAAALAAAEAGARTVVVDDNPLPGGQIWRDGPRVALPAGATRHRNAIALNPNIRLCSATRVVAASGPRELLLENAERGWRMGWRKLILCTGARERLLPFPGWTLPGVTGAGALQALIKSGMPVAGERIVIAGSGPLLLAAAATATKAGAKVVRVAEQASFASVAGFALQLARWPAKAVQSLGLLTPHYRTGSHVVAASGAGRVTTVRLSRAGGRSEDIACDRLACGFGLVPNTELGQLLGCAVVVQHGAPALVVDTQQATSVPDIYAAGENTGVGGSERALLQGRIAGHAAAGEGYAAAGLLRELARWKSFAAALHRHFALDNRLRRLAEPDTLVCRCEDVSHGALASCTGWTDAKLHTRCGMGACQGRVCGAAAQFIFGWTPTAPRPPLSPVRVGTLAALQAAAPSTSTDIQHLEISP
jgi:NADPH-dependent 2,4-dienoyl-CoA reductase/sulfur reductase-like enzyme